MFGRFRNVIFVGIVLVILNGFVFYTIGGDGYFVFSLITVVGYAVYVFDLVREEYKGRSTIEIELIQQRAKERLLKETVARQTRLLQAYKRRVDRLIHKPEKKPKEIVVERTALEKTKRNGKSRRNRLKKKK